MGYYSFLLAHYHWQLPLSPSCWFNVSSHTASPMWLRNHRRCPKSTHLPCCIAFEWPLGTRLSQPHNSYPLVDKLAKIIQIFN